MNSKFKCVKRTFFTYFYFIFIEKKKEKWNSWLKLANPKKMEEEIKTREWETETERGKMKPDAENKVSNE